MRLWMAWVVCLTIGCSGPARVVAEPSPAPSATIEAETPPVPPASQHTAPQVVAPSRAELATGTVDFLSTGMLGPGWRLRVSSDGSLLSIPLSDPSAGFGVSRFWKPGRCRQGVLSEEAHIAVMQELVDLKLLGAAFEQTSDARVACEGRTTLVLEVGTQRTLLSPPCVSQRNSHDTELWALVQEVPRLLSEAFAPFAENCPVEVTVEDNACGVTNLNFLHTPGETLPAPVLQAMSKPGSAVAWGPSEEPPDSYHRRLIVTAKGQCFLSLLREYNGDNWLSFDRRVPPGAGFAPACRDCIFYAGDDLARALDGYRECADDSSRKLCSRLAGVNAPAAVRWAIKVHGCLEALAWGKAARDLKAWSKELTEAEALCRN